jgi:hypothetical protein
MMEIIFCGIRNIRRALKEKVSMKSDHVINVNNNIIFGYGNKNELKQFHKKIYDLGKEAMNHA